VSLVTAAAVAKRYAVSRDYVYAHAAELRALTPGLAHARTSEAAQ
jgi:hypothetical protein